MSDDFSIEVLAQWTGEPVERLREWCSLGLIGSEESDRYSALDVERARLVRLTLNRGVGLDTLARIARERRGLWYGPLVPTLLPKTDRPLTLEQAADEVGVDAGLLRRLWDVAGLSEPGGMLDGDDVEMVRLLKVAFDAGFPEEALLQVVRVFADSFARLTEAETRLFHFYLYERLRTAGLAGSELEQATDVAGTRLYELIEPTILYFHKKGLNRAGREDALMHVQEDAGLIPAAEVPGQFAAAVVFVDISSFTPLTDAMGDIEAARVLGRFSDFVRESVNGQQGRVVKQIGDAFMLVFSDARSAVASALDIEQRAAGEPQFPAVRGGIHWGPVLYREGDYLGANVNIAARVGGEAGRHQVLVTGDVRREAAGLEDVEFVPLGKRRLRGVADELLVFEARSAAAEERTKVTDPVCGMELTASEVAARLAFDGEERVFCSEDCLRRFVSTPHAYQPAV